MSEYEKVVKKEAGHVSITLTIDFILGGKRKSSRRLVALSSSSRVYPVAAERQRSNSQQDVTACQV